MSVFVGLFHVVVVYRTAIRSPESFSTLLRIALRFCGHTPTVGSSSMRSFA
jgi:hypothetical protein